MDTINDNLSLTVINDGDGKQCGYDYRIRCIIFGAHVSAVNQARDALRMVIRADDWMHNRGYQRCSAFELLDQAAKVVEYYAEHVKDLGA